MARQWYILQVHSGFEERVKATLEERIAKEGLEDYFGEILVPTGIDRGESLHLCHGRRCQPTSLGKEVIIFSQQSCIHRGLDA